MENINLRIGKMFEIHKYKYTSKNLCINSQNKAKSTVNVGREEKPRQVSKAVVFHSLDKVIRMIDGIRKVGVS